MNLIGRSGNAPPCAVASLAHAIATNTATARSRARFHIAFTSPRFGSSERSSRDLYIGGVVDTRGSRACRRRTPLSLPTSRQPRDFVFEVARDNICPRAERQRGTRE